MLVKEVEIYTSPLCGFCHAAKRLLTSKDVNFAEVMIQQYKASITRVNTMVSM